jgi:hypothetical protein
MVVAEFELAEARSWTFGIYLFVIGYAVLLFLMSAALVPSGVVDYRDFFDARKTWLMGLIVTYALVDIIDSALKGQDHLRDLGWPYAVSEIACIVLPIAATRIRSTAFQGGLAIAFLADQLWFGFGSIGSIHS